MAKPVWRPRVAHCTLSEAEHQALCDVKAALGLTTRDLVLMAIRRARRIVAEERRKQRGNGQ